MLHFISDRTCSSTMKTQENPAETSRKTPITHEVLIVPDRTSGGFLTYTHTSISDDLIATDVTRLACVSFRLIRLGWQIRVSVFCWWHAERAKYHERGRMFELTEGVQFCFRGITWQFDYLLELTILVGFVVWYISKRPQEHFKKFHNISESDFILDTSVFLNPYMSGMLRES